MVASEQATGRRLCAAARVTSACLHGNSDLRAGLFGRCVVWTVVASAEPCGSADAATNGAFASVEMIELIKWCELPTLGRQSYCTAINFCCPASNSLGSHRDKWHVEKRPGALVIQMRRYHCHMIRARCFPNSRRFCSAERCTVGPTLWEPVLSVLAVYCAPSRNTLTAIQRLSCTRQRYSSIHRYAIGSEAILLTVGGRAAMLPLCAAWACRWAAAVDVRLSAVLDAVVARCHGALLGHAEGVGTINHCKTLLAVAAPRATKSKPKESRATAVNVRLISVPHSIEARVHSTRAARTDVMFTVGAHCALLAVGTRAADGPTTVNVRLSAVLDAVVARRRGTRAARADVISTVGGHCALLAVGTRAADGPTTVNVRLSAVLHAVVARCRGARAARADVISAVGGHCALLAVGTRAAVGPTAVDVRFGTIMKAIRAGRALWRRRHTHTGAAARAGRTPCVRRRWCMGGRG